MHMSGGGPKPRQFGQRPRLSSHGDGRTAEWRLLGLIGGGAIGLALGYLAYAIDPTAGFIAGIIAAVGSMKLIRRKLEDWDA